MSDSVFRTTEAPEPVAEPTKVDKTPGVSESKDSTTKLLATYQDATGHPYTAQYFEITNIWKDPKGGFETEVSTIESYIKDLVSDDRLDNSTEAADKLFEELIKKASIDPEDSTTRKLIKLSAYVRMQREIDSAMKWRQERG